MHLVGDLGGRKHAHPGGGQFEAQGNASHESADAGHRRQILLFELEAGHAAAGDGHEEFEGFTGIGHFGHFVDRLQAEIEAHPRGDDAAQPRDRGAQLAYALAALQEVFEVVQHQQQVFALEGVDHLLQGLAGSGQGKTQGFGQGRQDTLRRIERIQGHQGGPVAVIGSQSDGQFQGQARFADAPGPQHGEAGRLAQ